MTSLLDQAVADVLSDQYPVVVTLTSSYFEKDNKEGAIVLTIVSVLGAIMLYTIATLLS